jgi:large subunit ribosomal protein L22
MVEPITDPSKGATAVVRYLRIAPRKMRLVTRAITKKPVPIAFSILTALKKKAARMVEKGLHSAVANAKVKGLEESRLLVWRIQADGGPVMKRFMSRSMGRADQILKRTTHLSILVQEGERSFTTSSTPVAESKEKGGKAKPNKEKKAAQGKVRKAAAAKA